LGNLLTNYSQNLFGAIAGYQNGVRANTPHDFIPANGEGKIIPLTGKDATWLGLRSAQMQYWAYIYCAPLASVIDRLAESDVTGKLRIIKDDETDMDSQSPSSKRILKLLNKPNPMQTWRQFRAQQVVYKKIFGWCPVFPVSPIPSDPTFATSIWNLPPWLCSMTPGDGIFYKTGVEQIIKELRVTVLGQTITLKGDQFFTIDDGMIPDEWNGFLTPLSKVAGLDWAISNILASMEADNVLLRKKGPIGVWTHKPTSDNVAGYMPMTEDMKQELQNSLQSYGLGFNQFQHLISRNTIAYESAGYNVKDLMTKETVKQSIEAICDRFGYDIQLLSNEKGTTFENKNAVEKGLYQNNIIPNNIGDMEEYNRFFGTAGMDTATCITVDYSELPVMQEDEVRAGNALQGKTTALDLQYKSDVITLNQYRIALGNDATDGGDVYYSQSTAKKLQDEQARQAAAGAGTAGK
jgi:hypothetical protein